jgi:hypothetical protein
MAFDADKGSGYENAALLINALFTLLSSLTAGWTEKQLKTIWAMEAFGGGTGSQRRIAKKFGITDAAVSDSLANSKYYAYQKAWGALMEYLALEANTPKTI